MNLIIILAILFIALLVMVPLIERFGPQLSQDSTSKLWRWVMPLMILLTVMQLIAYFMGK